MPRLTVAANAILHSREVLKKPATALLSSIGSNASSVNYTDSTWVSMDEHYSMESVPSRLWTHQPYTYQVLPPNLPSVQQCYFESYVHFYDEEDDLMHGECGMEYAVGPTMRQRLEGPPRITHTLLPAVTLPEKRKLMLNKLRSVHLAPLPTFPTPAQGDTVYLYHVRHKRRTTTVWSPTHYAVGSVLVVDGDQGLDIGEVSEVRETTFKDSRKLPSQKAYRLADFRELEECLRLTKTLEERSLEYLTELTEFARVGVLNNDSEHGTYASELAVMNISDVELQADHMKIYIYFTACRQITFCHLTRALYRLYRCRVWLFQTNLNVSSSANTSTETETNRLFEQ